MRKLFIYNDSFKSFKMESCKSTLEIPHTWTRQKFLGLIIASQFFLCHQNELLNNDASMRSMAVFRISQNIYLRKFIRKPIFIQHTLNIYATCNLCAE